MTSKEITVLLFGSFDGIHKGHEYLINEAGEYGSNIIVVVAQDSVITAMKKRPPTEKLETRMQHLQEFFPHLIVVPGDIASGTWSAITRYHPDIIIVGYDQYELYDALLTIQNIHQFRIVQIGAFKPEQYKSSIVRNKKNQ
ncbi:adenylyltransferase/cytidyltransferase family protein [Patescibacteria group bacterium]|nr:adenylyltransferase/cytidyltransferase family protein [Patescibacteria group bacterium]